MSTRSHRHSRLVNRRQFLHVGLAAAGAAMSSGFARARSGSTSPVVEALTLDGGRRTLPTGALQDLAGALRGALLLPRDDGYDQARQVANVFFDRRPAFIVQATGAAVTSGFYVNDMAGGVTPAEVAADYGANAARLAAVKAHYDPRNLFQLNANINPALPPARAHT